MLIITHKFREVMGFCDEVTVLRQGRLTGEGHGQRPESQAAGRDDDGHRHLPEQAARADRSRTTVRPSRALVIEKLTADNENGVQVLGRSVAQSRPLTRSSASPACPATASGSWCEVLAGQRKPDGGQIRRSRRARYAPAREEMRRHRFNVLPEMPLHNACVGTMTTAENLAFRTFDRPPVTIGKVFVNRRSLRQRAKS